MLAHHPGLPAGPATVPPAAVSFVRTAWQVREKLDPRHGGKSLFFSCARSEGRVFLGWWAVAWHVVRPYTHRAPRAGSALYLTGWGAPQHRGRGRWSVKAFKLD